MRDEDARHLIHVRLLEEVDASIWLLLEQFSWRPTCATRMPAISSRHASSRRSVWASDYCWMFFFWRSSRTTRSNKKNHTTTNLRYAGSIVVALIMAGSRHEARSIVATSLVTGPRRNKVGSIMATSLVVGTEPD